MTKPSTSRDANISAKTMRVILYLKVRKALEREGMRKWEEEGQGRARQGGEKKGKKEGSKEGNFSLKGQLIHQIELNQVFQILFSHVFFLNWGL